MTTPTIAVLAGGTSPEREVSLGSGRAVAQAMAYSFPTQFFPVDRDALPEGLDPARHVICSTLHGVFGEDGGMQGLLDAAGFSYSGCDAKGSALCFDKWRTRQAVSAMGVLLGFPAATLLHRTRVAKRWPVSPMSRLTWRRRCAKPPALSRPPFGTAFCVGRGCSSVGRAPRSQ